MAPNRSSSVAPTTNLHWWQAAAAQTRGPIHQLDVHAISCVPLCCFVHRGLLSPLSHAEALARPFAAAALRSQTDKVSKSASGGHQYHRLYSPWLDPLATADAGAIQMLEIGLGCQGAGAGATSKVGGRSIALWLDLFKHSKLHVTVIELMEGACAPHPCNHNAAAS